MLGDCEVIGEEVKAKKMPEKSINALKSPVATSLSSPPPTKKLKQARLSFKILEPKPVVESTLCTPPSGKKRKHSDTSVGGQKASKLQKSDDGAKVKQPKHEDAENEVSSSSEAELVGKALQDQRAGKPRGLDRFVQSTQQLEVSTSCADVVDLTSDDSSTSANIDKPKVTKESTPKATEAAQSKEAECAESDNTTNKTTQKVTENKQKQKEVEKCPETTKDESKVEPEEDDTSNEQKPDCDNSMLDSTMDTSVVSQSLNDTTEASDDEKASESSDDDDSSDTKDTSVCSTAPSTPSTPASRTLKRPPMSASKAKQKEEERQKRNEEKEKAKAEKLRLKEAEKQKKEELRKERERLKEEKEKQKREEKEKKEQERLQKEKERQEKLAEKEKEKEEKLRQKEEEKKKKQEAVEAKLEEKKRKEEEREAERKKKEEEKLNAEAQKNRKMGSQSLFKKFFKKVEVAEPVKTTEKVGPFAAFNVLPNMRMAPRVRASLPTERCQELDQHMQQQSASVTELYVQQLRSGSSSPGGSQRTWPAEEDLVILEDGQPPAEKHKAKMLKFHENYRPAYWGTWRKQSKKISPRNPFRKDEDFLDYDVDSDDEWEEEEPGESLSNSEGEGEEGEADKEDDEEDDGFFVPHGYLSDGEGAEDDEEEDGNPEKMKMRQIIKAKAFEAELKKRTEVLHKMVIGCLWCTGDAQTDSRLAPYTASFLVDESPIMIGDATEASTKQRKSKNKNSDKPPKAAKEPKGAKAQQVPEEAMEQLIRLVHGNMAGLKKLVREFRVFWSRTRQQKETSSVSPNTTDVSMDLGEDSEEKSKSPVITAEKGEAGAESSEKKESPMDTGDAKDPDLETEEGEGSSVISKRQMDIKLRSIAVYEKRKGYHKKCWYVNQDVLEKYSLTDLPVPTEWVWITPGPAKTGPPKKELQDNTATPSSKKQAKEAPSQSTPNNHSIKQFAVPGLVHTYEAVQAAKPAISSPSPSPAAAAVKKQAKRITPITLFCAKKPSSENTLKPAALNISAGKPPIVAAVVKADSSVAIKTSVDDDDDCMIVEEAFVPPPPSKSQPTLLAMLSVKNVV